jgi:assimilatory nitrate reductase catalytic subunit
VSALKETRSTCPYCGVGCGVIIESQGGQITGVRGDPDHPANFGRLCSKGSTLALTATAPITLHQRLRTPQLHGKAVSWDLALDTAANRLAAITTEHGPNAIGMYISGQLLTEDYYVFNKLAKGLLGTNNIDTNSRLCMSSAVAGYKATLGADAPPCSYQDLDHAGTVFIAGSNMAWAHPVLFRRLEDAKRAKPEQKWIVVDPRRTETAEAADLHLQILPGSDVALFHGMLHLLLWEGLADAAFIRNHTTGFEALRDRVRGFHPGEVARICGIPEDALVLAARWFGAGPTLSLYCQGLNQSHAGTAKNAALINLHLATAHIGKPGAGPFSLTGQPNAMGGREVGGLANLLSAHRDMGNAAHRAEVAALWGVPSVPSVPGKTAVDMFEAAADGEIKALWIACTNPAQSLPDQATVRRALQRAEFVIVQEAFAHTATTPYAHLLLPASSWGEKEGTVTNSERRISRVRAAVPAPGEARHDWAMVVDIAQRLEKHLRPGQPTLFPYESAESVWLEHRESTRGRDLDITGLSYALLDRAGPQQWPLREGQSQGQGRLYEDAQFATADGRAKFFDAPYVAVAEPRDARYPFSLNTGRLRDQWHGMSRTGTVGRLFGHAPEPSLDLHAQDMARLKLAEGDLVRVRSRRGSVVLPARSSSALRPTQSFVAMHWGEEFVGGSGPAAEASAWGVNTLTSPARCPQSKQPELKHAAVALEPAALPWRLLGAAWLCADTAAQARLHLRQQLGGLGYVSVVPFGQQGHGVLVRAAAASAPALDVLMAIETMLGMPSSDTTLLRFADTSRGQRRTMRLSRADSADTTLQAFMLAGDASAEPWVRALLQDQQAVQRFAAQLLRPGAVPPGASVVRKQVCNCFDVDETLITRTLAPLLGSAEERLTQLQNTLKCGTQCGSCLPALRRLVKDTQTVTV